MALGAVPVAETRSATGGGMMWGQGFCPAAGLSPGVDPAEACPTKTGLP